MRHNMFSPAWTRPALALLALSSIAAKPAQLYPDFAARKAGLGPIALVADLVVVENAVGDAKKVYREDCRDLGRGLIDLMASQLEGKGYSFSNRRLVSVGHVMSESAQYRVLDTWAQHTEDASKFPIQPPPFFQDTTVAASDSARAAWHELLNGVWAYHRKGDEPAVALGSITRLREVIGADHALVVVVVGCKTPASRELLSGLPGAGGGDLPHEGFVAGVDIAKYHGTGIKLALLDCRSGEVLWSDGEHHDWRVSLNKDNLELLTKNVLKRLS